MIFGNICHWIIYIIEYLAILPCSKASSDKRDRDICLEAKAMCNSLRDLI